jgi:hypothetical protein
MPVLSRYQFLIERVLRTASYHDVAAAGQRRDLQRVLQALTPIDVSWNYGERLDLQFRGVEREQNCERIIDAGICIDDHSLW